ncbi:hypothetical protein ACSNOH_03475 [Streptomyces sp. URMC 127]|uniref:hypothetical protein n=1 Tax=Streptomyces sp. URMC 127 TaxID=3423402 RepID=UPI003F1DBB8E
MSWYTNADDHITRHPEPPSTAGATLYDIAGLHGAALRRSIAVHEAGHAVLGFAFGIPVAAICVREDLGMVGEGPAAWVQWGRYWDVPWQRSITMCAAGERAEDRRLREEGLWTPERAWVAERTAESDRQCVADVLRAHCGMTLSYGCASAGAIDYATVTAAADAALDHLWDRVLSLAAALDQRGHLTGRQAARSARLTHIAITCDDAPARPTGVEDGYLEAIAAARGTGTAREAA